MEEKKELAHVIIEEGKGPKGWQLTFLEENFVYWKTHAFPHDLSKPNQEHMAKMYSEGDNIVLISGGFESLKRALLKGKAVIYELDLLEL